MHDKQKMYADKCTFADDQGLLLTIKDFDQNLIPKFSLSLGKTTFQFLLADVNFVSGF
jgi:hypothetical protein